MTDHESLFPVVRKAFREGWQTGRYGGRKRRYAFLIACLWAANRVAEAMNAGDSHA